MRHVFKLFLITFLLATYTQVNAGISFCGAIAAEDDGSKKTQGDGKKTEVGDEEEEPDCD